ncbi:hypothetical protein JTB14_025814 [Gonioctena quinquepunctata]|nr:hypothetical protein JTB14_025814 [Gonioctena quinquepunctata]
MSSETEEEDGQGLKKRRRSSPESEAEKKRRLQVRCECGGTRENHRFLTDLDDETFKANVQRAILRQEIGGFQSYNEPNETARMRTSLEQAEMENKVTEEKQIRKKDEPCDCGGTSTHHMICMKNRKRKGKNEEGSKNLKESAAVKFIEEKIPIEDPQEAGPSRSKTDKPENVHNKQPEGAEEIPRRCQGNQDIMQQKDKRAT